MPLVLEPFKGFVEGWLCPGKKSELQNVMNDTNDNHDDYEDKYLTFFVGKLGENTSKWMTNESFEMTWMRAKTSSTWITGSSHPSALFWFARELFQQFNEILSEISNDSVC